MMNKIATLCGWLLALAVTSEAVPCPLCSGGADPSIEASEFVKNLGITYKADAGAMPMTCAGMEEVMATFSDEDVASGRCEGWQELAHIIGCGCPAPPNEDRQCSTCPFIGTPVEIGLDGTPIESAESTFQACHKVRLSAGSDECSALESTGKCPIPEDVPTLDAPVELCPICPGGNQNMKNPDAEVFYTVSCTGLAWLATVQFMDTLQTEGPEAAKEQCAAFSNVVGPYCECHDVDVKTEENVCRICGDNKLMPDPNRLPFFTALGPEFESTRCGAFEVAAQSDPATCAFLQEHLADDCCGPADDSCPEDVEETEEAVGDLFCGCTSQSRFGAIAS